MKRRILITGSEGHLGRALRARFEALGDEVTGIDVPGSGAEIEADLDWVPDMGIVCGKIAAFVGAPDVVVNNAKLKTCDATYMLGREAKQSIINIGSIYGVLGNDQQMYEGTEVEPTPAWYAASKGALVALTRWQATNLAPVRANCVCPGGIYRGHSDKFRQRYEQKVPLARMATEDDVVNAVEFLADERRAAYITGQVLMVDGGLSCRA